MLGVYFFAQTEEKGALLKVTLRFSCFIASFKKGVTLRFADYIIFIYSTAKEKYFQ